MAFWYGWPTRGIVGPSRMLNACRGAGPRDPEEAPGAGGPCRAGGRSLTVLPSQTRGDLLVMGPRNAISATLGRDGISERITIPARSEEGMEQAPLGLEPADVQLGGLS